MFCLILCTRLIHALDFSLQAGSSIKFNSYIEGLTLLEHLHNFEQGKKSELKRSFLSGADLQTTLFLNKRKSWTIDYSMVFDYVISYPEESIFDQSIGVGWSRIFSEKLYFELSGYMHHAVEEFPVIKTMYVDAFGGANIFYDFSDKMTCSFSAEIAYYKNIDYKIKYLNGPMGRLEGSTYFYLWENFSFLQLTTGGEMHYYRDVEFDFGERSLNDAADPYGYLTVTNKYIRYYAQSVLRYLNNGWQFITKLEYAYLHYLKLDVWQSQEKRHREHMFTARQKISWRVNDVLSMAVFYQMNVRRAEIGVNIYIDDYNRLQSIGGLSLELNYE